MFSLALGSVYEITLSSGEIVKIIVYGSKSHSTLGTVWDISVGGVRSEYSDLNQALGDSFTKIVLVS